MSSTSFSCSRWPPPVGERSGVSIETIGVASTPDQVPCASDLLVRDALRAQLVVRADARLRVWPPPDRGSVTMIRSPSSSALYQTGMRCPHQSWREMHQSRMFSIQFR